VQSADVAVVSGQTAEQKLALAHAVLLKTEGLQFTFSAMPVQKPPTWLEPIVRFLEAIGPMLQYVFWGGLIAGAALILYFIARELVPESWFRKSIKVTATDWRPEPEAARALLEDAEGLAAQGMYEAAIHLLLFRSIDDLAGRRPGVVKPALTSRDIATLEVIPPAPRAAFARLAQTVERTFFGGRAAGAETFAAARQDYAAFAFPEAWR
jgi:hypothetical protein